MTAVAAAVRVVEVIAPIVLPPLLKAAAVVIHDAIHDENISEKEIPVHCELAGSYGNVNGKNIHQLDENLRIVIAGTTKAIAQVESKSWDAVISCMLQNSLLESTGDVISRSNKKCIENYNFFKFDGSPDEKVVKEVLHWFENTLIKDEDVIEDTGIDVEAMAKLVAETGARVTGPLTAIYKAVYEEKKVVDVGILRYPDHSNPFFKVYRIQLLAWRECNRILVGQKDKSGILGRYNMSKFQLRDSVLSALKAGTRSTAAEEAAIMYVQGFPNVANCC